MAVIVYADLFADDAEEVGRIASLLEISEFQLFQAAYFLWFGVKISDKEMEPFFVEYMFRNVVPYWVRNLLRTVERRIEEGDELNPAEFNIDPPHIIPEIKSKGFPYVALVSVLFIFYCILLSNIPPE